MSFNLIPQVYAATNEWSEECVVNGVATIKGINCLFERILSPLPALIAFAAVLMVIFAGARLVTAGADPKAVASAWSSFTWAIIGVILLAGVWVVLTLIQQFTGANILNFGI